MGYGTKILKHTIKLAEQKGFKFFRLYTDMINPNAHSLYDKIMDFKEEYSEGKYHVLIYSKSLCEQVCPKLNNRCINLADKEKEQDNGYELYLNKNNH